MEPQPDTQRADALRAGPAPRPGVLVIDDTPSIREEMLGLLLEEGYDAQGAANGSEALARLRNGWTPGLILLDLMMPVMDGWSFYERKQDDPRLSPIPVVVISAYHAPEGHERRLPASAWLSKPFNIEEFLGLIARYCGPPRRPPSGPGPRPR